MMIKRYAPFLLGILALFVAERSFSQEMPPRPIAVYFVRSLSFGAFIPGNLGGTITVSPDGNRTTTGDVIPVNLGYLFYETVFELEGNRGTLVSVMTSDEVILTGNLGGTMVLHLGESIPPSPVVLTTDSPSRTQYHLGGTLDVGNILANPPGQYNGVFFVTFIQE